MSANNTLRWGVLGAAKIAIEKVIPAIQKAQGNEVIALASRNLDTANEYAKQLNIPKTFGSYEALLSDDNIDAIYIPLPNHLHVEWTKKAILAGKHVLCEKPLALEPREVEKLIALRNQEQGRVAEAFMVKYAPQWLEVRQRIGSGEIGHLKSIQGCFSYFNDDPENVRNKFVKGGGALWDIGVYPLVSSGFVLGEEPQQVLCEIERDPQFQTDVYTSALVKFQNVTLSFQCSTQLIPYQRMHFFGTEGSIEVMIPFNAPHEEACIVKIHKGDIWENSSEILSIPASNQYTLQAEGFAKAVFSGEPFATELEDTLQNTRCVNALFESAQSRTWVKL